MPKRQAADGEITEGIMATYEHGEQAAAVVAADLREGIQETEHCVVLAVHGPRLSNDR
jgi:hypothetical protein